MKRSLKDAFKELADEPVKKHEKAAELVAEPVPIPIVGEPTEHVIHDGNTYSIVELVKAGQPEALFEQEFARNTLYIRKDIRKEVDRLAKKYPKGFKTKMINYAIAKVLREEFDIDIEVI